MHTTDDNSPRHANTVLRMLFTQRQVENVHGTWPFGVELEMAWGRFAVGEFVLAPGIDDCSPKLVAEVLRTGTRADQPGIWCLLRHRGQALPSALIREDSLRAIAAPRPSALVNDASAGAGVSRPAALAASARVS